MSFDKPILHWSNPFKKFDSTASITRTIYYGEVVSIEDPTDGGRIKVKIPHLDSHVPNENLPWCYPLMPKFFHNFPQIGEMVRIFIEDIKYPNRSRFWLGSIISQPHKIGYDSIFTALSTTNMGVSSPDPAPSTIPEAAGIYPNKEDIAIVGRVNTDIILRINQMSLRVGKHENNNPLKINAKNPAEITMTYENLDKDTYYSNTIILSDKIALISHTGKPQFKAVNIDSNDRKKIFENGHPIARGDVLVEALKALRKAIVNHIHGYSSLPADKNALIQDLEKINFDNILQENIVIN